MKQDSKTAIPEYTLRAARFNDLQDQEIRRWRTFSYRWGAMAIREPYSVWDMPPLDEVSDSEVIHQMEFVSEEEARGYIRVVATEYALQHFNTASQS